MFVPPDEQSSAAMFIDGHFHNDTERSIAEMYEGAEVKKSAVKVNGKNVEWWRWKDSRQVYSNYIVTLADADGTARVIVVNVGANSHDRLAALEYAFSTIEFL